jgi:hypothetical protein
VFLALEREANNVGLKYDPNFDNASFDSMITASREHAVDDTSELKSGAQAP